MKEKKFLVAFLFASLFWACSGLDSENKDVVGGTTEDAGIVAVENRDIAGVSQKGPFVTGSTVTVQELDGVTLKQTGKSFKGRIKSDKGDFAIKGVNLLSQYAILEASGYYRDEISGKKSTGTVTLYALTDLSNRKTVNINLLTHLEYERVMYLVTEKKMPIADAKSQAEKEILSTETFRKGAVGRYELVYIDNPRNQDLLSEHGKENNRKLTSKYDIHGFPTVLILDADGKKVAEMGYDAGGPEKYLEKIEEEVKYGPDIKKYIAPVEEKLKGPGEAMQKEMQEAMKGIAKKYVAIYEQAFKDARAMKVPAHMEKRKEEVISKQERQFKRLKSFVEEKEK